MQSSLYFCHVDAPADASVRETLQSADGIQRLQADRAATNPKIPPDDSGAAGVSHHPWGKRLPGTPPLELGTRPSPPPKVFPHLQGPVAERAYGGIARKPVGSGPARGSEGSTDVEASRKARVQEPSPRKVLGPRQMPTSPISTRHSVDASMPTRREADGLSSDGRRWSEIPGLRGGSGSPDRPAGGGWRQVRRPEPEPEPSMFTVTLIRRDPTSGGQWNVGRITLESYGPSGVGASPRKGGGAAGAEIEIDTDGYEKFTARPADARPTTNGAGDAPVRSVFRRWLSLHPPGSSSSPTKEAFRAAGGNSSAAAPFAFASPWGGSCEFATGLAGRGLKCRHYFHAQATAVSELRPNLPGVGLLAPKSPKQRPPLATSSSAPSPRLGKRFSAALHARNRSADGDQDESDDDEDEGGCDGPEGPGEGRMDLSLGRERAGGGRRGRTAKLGKLVVEREGMVMLDLVVAANMGVWWSLATRDS